MEDYQRPNRSDIHLSEAEEAKIQEETREYFDDLAPKRHTKPQRSEYSTQYIDDLSSKGAADHGDGPIPEFVAFQQLEHDTQKLSYGGNEPTEEFVETEYYKDLNCVDKQHHTTGTGFISVENANGTSFSLAPDGDNICHSSCTGNPATNDWTPDPTNTVDFVSDKPRRSDN